MLWTDDILFLHLPKTAGKSLTLAFLETLGRPLTCIVSQGQKNHIIRQISAIGFAHHDVYPKWMKSLELEIEKLLASYRWKFGDFFVGFISQCFFRTSKAKSLDRIRSIFKEFYFFETHNKGKIFTIHNKTKINPDGLTIIEGHGHENLLTAQEMMGGFKKKLEDFKAIIVAIRNPYDLMVSNYFFMRKTYHQNDFRENFKIAMENDFEGYALKVGFAPIENWMTMDGCRPENLKIIRFEHLQEDFDALSRAFGFASIPFLHLNASTHDHYLKYLTPTAEEAIYQKFKYLFDEGFYERHTFS